MKILDFGLAKLAIPEPGAPGMSTQATLDSVTGRGVLLGTLGYMSPEQCRGATIDARSDIFSFGAVLYEMVSGKRAFRGDTTADTISSILKEEPPDLSAADVMCRRCWSALSTIALKKIRLRAFSLRAMLLSRWRLCLQFHRLRPAL